MASFTRTRKVSVANPNTRARPKQAKAKKKAPHGHSKKQRPKMSAAARAQFAERMAAYRNKKTGKRNPTTMAKKKTSSSKKKSPAKKNPSTYKKSRRRNPTVGRVVSGFGMNAGIALVALVGTRQIPQMLLGENNTGIYGYAANLAATLALAYAAHFAAGPAAAQAALIGGGLYLVNRILTEKVAPIGQYLSLTGLGDASAASSLGTIADGYFVHPTIVDKNGRPMIPQAIIDAANAGRPALPAGATVAAPPNSMAGLRIAGRIPDRFAKRF